MTKRANLAAALHDAGAKPAQMPPPAPVVIPEVAAAGQGAATRPPSRTGQRAVTVYVKPEAHKQLRLLGLEQGASVQELMTEALNDLFRKHGRSLIA